MDKEERVREFLSKQKYVKLAYLFGSVAEGKEGKVLSAIKADIRADRYSENR